MKARSLQDLKAMGQRLLAQQALAEAQAAAALAAQRQAQAEQQLFSRSVGRVAPLPGQHQTPPVSLAPKPPTPIARQHLADEQAALHEALSDAFDASTLLDTDDALSFRRPGIGRDVTHKLRKGDWAIQRQLDLHNLRTEEAREQLAEFIRSAQRDGVRCVRVVHGKGLGSPGKTPVLKAKVHSWLIQKKQVLAFVQAKPAEGGAGALLVLLQPAKRAGLPASKP
ncbi:MAG: Smr/MutS family protein [Burkholderiaceae bacterium]